MAAIVPGRANNQFNLLSQARRQPGSTFKTFVLTAAVERGLDPGSTYYVSAPFTYRPTGRELRRRKLVVRQDLRLELQRLDLDRARDAALRQLGVRATDARRRPRASRIASPPARRADAARRPGSSSRRWGSARLPCRRSTWPLPTRPSLPVASTPSRPRFARSCCRTAIRTPGGARDHRRIRVVSDGVASVVTRILEDNIRYGTGTRAALNRPAAGKTGTTDEHADAWFVGYTPNLATAVWMGYTRGEIPMTNVHGISVSGGSFPAEIWRRFMEAALADRPTATSASRPPP